MINPTKYSTLYKCDKARLLRLQGEFIDAIETIGYRTSLYVLDGFYVEVLYSYANKQIEEIKVLEHDSRLDLYIRNIDIDKLMCA